jgi:hypothetical protein
MDELHRVPDPDGARVEVGRVLSNQHWWEPAILGVIVKIFMDKSRS